MVAPPRGEDQIGVCGIAGYVGQGDQRVLGRMIAAIKYRGPDDRGVFVGGDVGLAHARLSIIDLSAQGHQPMFNDSKNIAVIFNGEIYNFEELKENLLKLGKYNFRSKTDTEVIIFLYQEYGEKCFEKLNGMFAIAIYDFNKNKLILARDRMGKKPLYWGIFNSTFIFGSELKALIQHPAFKKELSLESLNKYLQYEYVPTPHCIFKGVYKLEPASYLVYENNKIRKEKFWEMSFGGLENDSPLLPSLDALLEKSVKERLISDVPLGIFLSGGLDSSTIAYYAQKNSNSKIKTFSIGFEEKSFNESNYANKVSQFLGTEHYSQILTPKDSLNMIPYVLNNTDEPFADPSIIPTYLLSKFTREKVTVALSGDGGDELFAGYPTFQADILADIYKKMPGFIRKNVLEKIILNLPVSDKNFSLDFKLKKFIEGAILARPHRHQVWLGSFNRAERRKLFNREAWQGLERKNEFEDTDKYFSEIPDVLYLYLRTYLMDDILVKADRASMLNSLEVRSPLLDYKVVDFVNSLPYDFKLRGWTGKYILKELMRDKLPHNIVSRPKKGFGIPLSYWLRHDLKGFCNEVLSEKNINNAGLFNFEYVNKLKHDHFSKKSNNRKLLWTLMIFQIWHNKWA